MGCDIFWNDASNRPTGGMGGIEFYGLIGVFERDKIGELSVYVLFVEVGNPVVFVGLFNGR